MLRNMLWVYLPQTVEILRKKFKHIMLVFSKVLTSVTHSKDNQPILLCFTLQKIWPVIPHPHSYPYHNGSLQMAKPSFHVQ